MKSRSLRLRLLVSHFLAIFVVLGLTGLGLVVLFERHVERRAGVELNTYLNQIAAKLAFDDSGKAHLIDDPGDPRFDSVFSGLYWQVEDEGSGKIVRSRSLWDTRIGLPEDMPPIGDIEVHAATGPDNSILLVHERRLIFSTSERENTARIAVAVDRVELKSATSAFATEVALALCTLGTVLIISAWVQVSVGLRPLRTIQTAIAAIREGKASRLKADVPTEITPLVDEVNGLLAAQESALTKARERASDLAHGFKTPLTALKTDVGRLRDRGQERIAADIETTSRLMQRQIERELAKARIRDTNNTAEVGVLQIVQGLIRTLKRTPQAETKVITAELDADVVLRMDRDDLSDVLGNLLENAIKYARKTVIIRAKREGAMMQLIVEDDGAGVGDDLRNSITERGMRLDQSRTGSGLGLAIVTDVLDVYASELMLGRSRLGGLSVSFMIPFVE